MQCKTISPCRKGWSRMVTWKNRVTENSRTLRCRQWMRRWWWHQGPPPSQTTPWCWQWCGRRPGGRRWRCRWGWSWLPRWRYPEVEALRSWTRSVSHRHQRCKKNSIWEKRQKWRISLDCGSIDRLTENDQTTEGDGALTYKNTKGVITLLSYLLCHANTSTVDDSRNVAKSSNTLLDRAGDRFLSCNIGRTWPKDRAGQFGSKGLAAFLVDVKHDNFTTLFDNVANCCFAYYHEVM